ncbi:MAG TPA: hypothetical protein VML75_04780 [Kofleriaceae bacterium]|nr:hypothetical protein [Kofleriaceae bacterium]
MPKPLAEIAIDAGLVDRDQVVEAAQHADETGEPLIVALVRGCGIDELGLVAAVRRQMRVPLSDPAHVKLDPDALREIPRAACRRLRVLPLSVAVYNRGPRLLRVAMADPTDTVAIAEIEHISGCRIEVTLMPLSAIEEMVEKGYRAFVTEVMQRAPAPAGKVRSGFPVAPITTPTARPGLGDDEETAPATMPFHRLSEEAHITLRHQALLDLLFDKKIISEDEYEEQVRQLMKQRADEG